MAVEFAKDAFSRWRTVMLLGGLVDDRTVSMLDAAFKLNTDMRYAAHSAPGVPWKDDRDDAATDNDVLLMVTGRNEPWNGTSLGALELDRLQGVMNRPGVVGLRNVYNPADAAKVGFPYSSIGREMKQP
jgi:UDPglucose 6-dehydrogenase